MKVGLLGYGYTASYFAQLLLANGHEVWGTTRDKEALSYDITPGIEIINFSQVDIVKCLEKTEALLISTPPDSTGQDPSLTLVHDLILANKTQFKWIAYLSSTGVYGDHQGQWVDENTPCVPNSQRAQNRLNSENAWISLYEKAQLPVMIFRLAGIYGPDRNTLQRLAAGKSTSVYKKGQYFSRIHVYDICNALDQSMLSPMPGEIFNVCDDCPSPSHEVDAFAAKLLAIKAPELIPYEQATLSPMAKEFYTCNRRVSNKKLKQHLLAQLRYPSYKQGLTALFQGESFL